MTSLRRTASENSGTLLDEIKCFKWFIDAYVFARNTPDDNTESPVSYDDMLEIYNQLSIYIGKKSFNKNFWDTETFLKMMKPKYTKWQQAWKNRIKHYTPRAQPDYDDISVDGVIEKWDPKLSKANSQMKTIKISPMFTPDKVKMYKVQTKRTRHLLS